MYQVSGTVGYSEGEGHSILFVVVVVVVVVMTLLDFDGLGTKT